MAQEKLFEKLKEYHFEFKHLTVLFIILIIFQLLISFINKSSIRTFLGNTQEWYQKDSAEKIANLTTTSIELLIETLSTSKDYSEEEKKRIIQSFNIIFSQQVLQHNIEELCIIVERNHKYYPIDEGQALYSFVMENPKKYIEPASKHPVALKMYREARDELSGKEQIISILTDKQTFHTFVPFVIRGEYMGALYMRNIPDFSFITNQIISNYDETSVIYLSLILLGLLAMYFISSYTVKERDDTQQLLFDEHEINLKKQINYEKELVFTKRIYHTHHKAEKVMGFIKNDLRLLSPENIDEVKYRVSKYSNFISRVIYDMKWFEPPLQTIRNTIFRTNLNEVIRFLVDNIFLRLSTKTNAYEIELDLDDTIPPVPINEFVVWEILEPIIQNSLDHGGEPVLIKIKTYYNSDERKTFVIISDNGKGISAELLTRDKNGIKALFQENVTTKDPTMQNAGYGCYIAYEMTKRCGWDIDAENPDTGGCRFTITVPN